jgi:Kef-type K+ transport system membrane component KefB
VYWWCFRLGYRGEAAFFISMILTATSMSISAQIRLELGVLRSREGVTLLGAAVVDDILVILLLSVVVAMADSSGGAANAVVFLRMLLYLSLATAAAIWLLPRLAPLADKQPVSVRDWRRWCLW